MTITAPSTHPLIGHTVEQQLMDVVDGLATGRLELADCTPAIVALFSLGELAASGDLEARVRQLEHENNRLYVLVHNPRERADLINRRMDAALDAGIHTTDFDQFEAMLQAALTPAHKEAA